ncbi:MAG: gamma-glutamylcyclotransferase family protein [Acidimicrobiales bacterium]
MPVHPPYYFAYGSNMWGAQMQERCPGATAVGEAELSDHRFRINQRGVATIVPESRSRVLGVVWNTSDVHIEALDGFEGLSKGNYTRELVIVDVGKMAVEAVVYVACHDRPGPPRAGYLPKVVTGATEFGLPESYVAELAAWATAR